MAPKDSKLEKEEEIIQLLDQVVETGIPVEFERKGKRLRIVPAEKRRELDRLEAHPDFVVGNPDDFIHLDWSSEWKPQT